MTGKTQGNMVSTLYWIIQKCSSCWPFPQVL